MFSIIYNNDRHCKKKIKNVVQDTEAKIETEKDHAEGKPSSETLHKAKVKIRDAL